MSKTEVQPVVFKKAKVSRNELELPTLHFIVMDQWVDLIGERALFAWLKMYTWCDRSNSDNEEDKTNLWEQAKIPTSFNKIIKKLKVGRTTFYEKILRPLWNVGLIDIEEYSDSTIKGTKPMNIIVYAYPQNNKSLSYQPLKEIRDYDKDYNSEARLIAKRKKTEDKKDTKTKNKNESQPRTESGQGGVPKEDGGVYQNGTGDGTEIGHNNSLNSNNNSPNNINNIFNYSSSSKTEISNKFRSKNIEEEDKIKQLFNNNIAYKILAEY